VKARDAQGRAVEAARRPSRLTVPEAEALRDAIIRRLALSGIPYADVGRVMRASLSTVNRRMRDMTEDDRRRIESLTL